MAPRAVPLRTVPVMTDIRCVVDACNELGEGPVWDTEAGVLWWVDIKRSLLQRLAPDGSVDVWTLPEPPAALAPRRRGGLILAVRSGFATFDPETGAVEVVHRPEPDRPGNRFNDGKCDPRGRFWAGTMDDAERERTGALYRFDPDGTCERLLDGLGIPNTLAWSADGSTFYFAETLDRVIHAYDVDLVRGSISSRRIFAHVEPPGYPDGSCLDAEGFLWNAEWGGGRVVRYAPDGSVDRIVEMPVDQPTSCVFGGPDLDVLYVTSARKGLSGQQLAQQEHAGCLFAVDPGVRGAPTGVYAG